MHIPVLLQEVIESLGPKHGDNFIDATFGDGGHAEEILKKIRPGGRLLGIDWDKNQIAKAEQKFCDDIRSKSLILVNDNYKNLDAIIRYNHFYAPRGILFDLGFSRAHIEEFQKGFSFRKDEPLIMRYGPEEEGREGELTAERILNTWTQAAIEEILREYGEERFSKKISERVIERRKKGAIRTTYDLVGIVESSLPRKYRRGRIHPATRTFQALRIAVNREFENIVRGVDAGISSLAPEGRLAVISFHSGEDRIVKNIFREKAREGSILLGAKKPIKPKHDEILKNPASRSALLRFCTKT